MSRTHMAYSIAFNTTENELQSETMLCRKLFFHDCKGVHAVYGGPNAQCVCLYRRGKTIYGIAWSHSVVHFPLY